MVSIAGLDKAALLAALYNNAKIQGRGIGHATAEPMTAEEASRVIGGNNEQLRMSFDYLRGRVLKIELAGDEMEEWLYDRDNGEGKAGRVIDNLRTTGSVAEII